jgi:hypothetical protein
MVFIYLICNLENHSYFLDLASEKPIIEDVYIWIGCREYFLKNLSIYIYILKRI